jgi:hypothetical protein
MRKRMKERDDIRDWCCIVLAILVVVLFILSSLTDSEGAPIPPLPYPSNSTTTLPSVYPEPHFLEKGAPLTRHIPPTIFPTIQSIL